MAIDDRRMPTMQVNCLVDNITVDPRWFRFEDTEGLLTTCKCKQSSPQNYGFACKGVKCATSCTVLAEKTTCHVAGFANVKVIKRVSKTTETLKEHRQVSKILSLF